MQEIDKFSDLDEMLRDEQKEKWMEELQEIERKRTELVPEHQKMQKRSQKLQSFAGQEEELITSRTLVPVKKKCKSSVRKWRKGRYVYLLYRRSRATVGWRQMIWKKKSRTCMQEKERRDSCALQSNGCCFDPAMVEQVFTLGAVHPCKKKGSEYSRFQALLCTRQEEKRDEKNGKGAHAKSGQSTNGSTSVS